MLSVPAVQLKETLVGLAGVADRLVGAVGLVVSGLVTVTVLTTLVELAGDALS